MLFLGAAYLEDKIANDLDDGSADAISRRASAAATASSDKAIAAFCFFLCLLYGIFSVLLARFRNYIVKENGE